VKGEDLGALLQQRTYCANSTPGHPSSQPFRAAGSTPDVCASNPEIGSGAPRSIQSGLKLMF